jgi:hypothetical protein
MPSLFQTKIVVHIDPLGSADPIPFGMGASPFARIRVQPLAGGLCRYAVSSSDPADEPEEDIVQTERVPSRIVQTSMSEYSAFVQPAKSAPSKFISLACLNSELDETHDRQHRQPVPE